MTGQHPVRAERERQGLTLETFSERAGVSVRSLSRAESFQSVSEETQNKIATALGREIADLWSEVRVGSIIAGPDGAYRVAATASDGSYIIVPVEFGDNEVVTAAEIKSRFGVMVQDATQGEPRGGWRSLAEASRVNANRIEQARAVGANEQARVNAAEERGWALMADAEEAR